MAMMDNLKADLEKEIQEMTFEEKDSQEDYEGMMSDASAKRAEDSKAITEKEGALAGLEAELHDNNDAKASTETEIMATKQYLTTLHADCDWLLENYAARKEARTNEKEALGKAKDVLNGADYSLLQLVGKHLRR